MYSSVARLLYSVWDYALAPGGAEHRAYGRGSRFLSGTATTPQLKLTIRELKERTMEWTSPKFEEVCLNCEINSYASAEL